MNILKMPHHVEDVLHEVAVSPDDPVASEQPIGEQILANYFNSIRYSGLKPSIKVCCLLTTVRLGTFAGRAGKSKKPLPCLNFSDAWLI